MLPLILGLALWVGGHLWNRFTPDVYARLGKASYAVSALIIVSAVVVIVMGYRSADFIPVWYPPTFFTHINNLLMVFALYTYFATATPKGTVWLVGNLRNPQLTGFKIWAAAHLLVNGDLASIVLFGGLMAWAVVEVILIKRQGEKFDRTKAKVTSRLGHLAIVVVALVIIIAIHAWVGVSPVGG
ncbi:MAG: NnrU family protein [Planktomarina sp.]